MAFIEGSRGNDPSSSPTDGFSELGQLVPLLPYALAFLSDDGYGAMKQQLRTWAKQDPMDALLAVVFGGGLAFYLAERDTNPGCKSPWDGILYMSTALSVGYDNLFPTTSAGHALATFAQTFGPSLANSAFQPPAAEELAAKAEELAVNKAILARLEDIVRLLETQR
jgi:voltage-gated potassium channel